MQRRMRLKRFALVFSDIKPNQTKTKMPKGLAQFTKGDISSPRNVRDTQLLNTKAAPEIRPPNPTYHKDLHSKGKGNFGKLGGKGHGD